MITEDIIKEQALLAILNITNPEARSSGDELLDKVLTEINIIAKVALDIPVSLERDFSHANENIQTEHRKVA